MKAISKAYDLAGTWVGQKEGLQWEYGWAITLHILFLIMAVTLLTNIIFITLTQFFPVVLLIIFCINKIISYPHCYRL